MNCDFNILWFEDASDWAEMEKGNIEEMLDKYGLGLNFEILDGYNFDKSKLCSNNYDLILIDYKLASGQKGNDIIKSIRNNAVLTDVLFYSSQYSDLLHAIKNQAELLDGVYYADRKIEEFEKKIKGLIAKIVKRSEDIINLRGMVLDNSSDFETRIRKILETCLNKFTQDEKSLLYDKIRQRINENCKKYSKFKRNTESDDNLFNKVINDVRYINNNDRLIILNNAIKIMINAYNLDKEKYSSFKENYESEISVYRNALSHRDTDKTIDVNGNIEIINRELYVKIRKSIKKQDELINDLERFVDSIDKNIDN